MRPKFPRTVLIRTPGPASVDPDSGNEIPGQPVETTTPAYLAQSSTNVLSTAVELAGRQDTTIATFTLLVPGSVVLTSKSEVVDVGTGDVYAVTGRPAQRRGLGRLVQFQAASLHLISDLQPPA